MACVHLQQLFQICQENQLKLSSSDLIHVVCKQCQKEEVCPSLLFEEYETKHPEEEQPRPPQKTAP
jgi:hypothetical protein